MILGYMIQIAEKNLYFDYQPLCYIIVKTFVIIKA